MKLSEISAIEFGFDLPGATNIASMHKCHQIHSDLIVNADGAERSALQSTKADGLVTTESRAIAVQTADCLPVLFADARGRAVAAVHAGWRGLCAGILVRASESLGSLGVRPEELCVAIGPAIGACCFEVSADVREEFDARWGQLWKNESGAPWKTSQPAASAPSRGQAPAGKNNIWLDLKHIARLQLLAAGLKAENIEDTAVCTYCAPGGWASHRRGTHEKTKAARQWSWIRIKKS